MGTSDDIMIIRINGIDQTFENTLTAAQLVEQLGLQGRRIAIEVNREILPRSSFDQYQFKENDQIEIIHAVGGG